MQYKYILIPVASLLAGCHPGASPEAVQSKAEMVPLETSTAQEAGRNKAMEMQETRNYAVPEGFNSYAMEDVGNEQLCVAGTLTDEDGMNQEASLYLVKKGDRGVVWGKLLKRPADTFQSRATHCVASGAFVYALVQDDTQSQQELSQTLLRVVKFNRDDGAVVSDKALMPATRDAYSASVAEGGAHFVLDNRQLTVRGVYVISADRENPIEFTQHMDLD